MARAAKAEEAGAKTYRATETVYVDERFIREGEVFTTAAPKGATWEEVGGSDPQPAPAPADDE